MIAKERLEQLRAHVDEGGALQHEIAVELLAEVERMRQKSSIARALIDDAFVRIRAAKSYAYVGDRR